MSLSSSDQWRTSDLKHSLLLPASMHAAMSAEQDAWKEAILSALDKAVTTQGEAQEPNWSLVSEALRLFKRFDALQYRFSAVEKEKLVKNAVSLLVHAKSTPGIQIRLAKMIDKTISFHDRLSIELEWRPIYDSIGRFHFGARRDRTPPVTADHGPTLVSLLSKLNRYFGSSAAKEILDEFRPRITPFDAEEALVAVGFLSVFLPSQGQQQNTIPDWFSEIMGLFDLFQDSLFFDQRMFSLLARVAQDNPGNVEQWRPYYSLLFTRILRSLDLPIGNMQRQSRLYRQKPDKCALFVAKSWEKQPMAALLAALMPDAEVIKFTKQLFKTIESYFYPSNSGEWQSTLERFLRTLVKSAAWRLSEEQSGRSSKTTPESFKFTNEFVEELVELLLKPALLCMYLKDQKLISGAGTTLQHLAYMSPGKVFPQLMDRVFYALQTLTETHLTSSALEVLGTVVLPMLHEQKNFPQGLYEYLPELLQATLPGIDANDSVKTQKTMRFIYNLLSVLPLWSSVGVGLDSEPPAVLQMFEEWALAFLDKILAFLRDYSAHSQPSGGKQSASASSASPFMQMLKEFMGGSQGDKDEPVPLLRETSLLLFQQMSPELHALCSKRIREFVSSSFLPNSRKYLSHLCFAAALRSKEEGAAASLRSFLQLFYGKIVDAKSKQINKSLSDSELEYWVLLMSRTVRGNCGMADASNQALVSSVLKLLWSQDSKSIVKAAGKLLRSTFNSLTLVYPTEYHSVSTEVWQSKDFGSQHWTWAGQFVRPDDAKISWHQPTAEELKVAADLFNTFVESPVQELRQFVENKDKKSASVVIALVKLRALLRGASIPLAEMTTDTIDQYTKTSLIEQEAVAPSPLFSNSELKETRDTLALLLHAVCSSALSSREVNQDPEFLRQIIKDIHTIISFRYRPFSKKSSAVDALQKHKKKYFATRPTAEHVLAPRSFPRSFLIERAHLLVTERYYLRKIPFVKAHELLLQDMRALSLGSFSAVRKQAQKAFSNSLKLFHPRLARTLLPSIIGIIGNSSSQENEDQLTGAIYLMLADKTVKRVSEDWDLLGQICLAMVQCTSQKPSIQGRLQVLFMMYMKEFKELPLTVAGEGSADTKYRELVNSLQQLLDQPTQRLSWMRQLGVHAWLGRLVRSPDSGSVYFPLPTLRVLLSNLNSDTDAIRTAAMKAVSMVLTQYMPNQARHLVSAQSVLQQQQLQQPIENDQQWQQTQFFDKLWFGWNSLPEHEVQVYDYSKSSQDSGAALEVVRATKDIVLDSPTWLSKLFEYMSISYPAENAKLSQEWTQFFKGLAQVFRLSFLTRVQPHLLVLLRSAGSGTPEESTQIAFLCTILRGLIRGTKHWTWQDQRTAQEQYFKPLLTQLMDQASVSCYPHIQELIRFVSFNTDLRRVRWLVDLLQARAEAAVLTATGLSAPQQAAAITFFTSVLYGSSFHSLSFSHEFVRKLVNGGAVEHQHKQVRDATAQALATLFYHGFKNQKAHQLCSEVIQALLVRKAAAVAASSPDVLKAFYDTLLTWVNIHVSDKENPLFMPIALVPYFDSIVSLVLEERSAVEDPSLEKRICEMLVSFAANALVPQASDAHAVMRTMMQQSALVAALSWRIRLAILQFIQGFGYRHQFYLLLDSKQEGSLTTVINHLLSLLKTDPSVEVRSQAGKSLGGFLVLVSGGGGGEQGESKLVSRVIKEASTTLTKLMASKKATTVDKAEVLKESHSAVLALGAVVVAHPYDVPDYLPAVLVLLARLQNNLQHTVLSNQQIITESIKAIFADFNRTHRTSENEWEQHKAKFSGDDLAAISSLQYSSYHYA